MSRELSHRIKQKALEIGFCGVGIARASELEAEGANLREWLTRGYQGTMEWMVRSEDKRKHPRKVLSRAVSVISVAYNYYNSASHPEDPKLGKISRYAWGDDYHDILEELLSKLEDFVRRESPGSRCKRYVDTGPVMDKAWAVRAGIGWLGKHTNVITRAFGSWIFLGEIMTDLELIPDDPIEDFCGSCTTCIEACPTEAIVEPYILDSRRCISYLTIEHKGEIPREFRGRLHNWIYGCDICQDVCPWNSFKSETRDNRLAPRADANALNLAHLAGFTQKEFSDRFKKSPVKRTKVSGLRRNARAVLKGRLSGQEAIE
jgi:epoxyqueuosine reductase